jgi:hypothetical protein
MGHEGLMALAIRQIQDEQLVICQADEIMAIWPTVRPLIERAVLRGHGEYLAEDVAASLLQGDSVLWLLLHAGTIRACAVVELLAYDRLRAARIVVLSGHGMKSWAHYIEVIEHWARDCGCERVEAICRPGFGRWLQRYGYERDYVVVTKDITDTDTVH